MYARCRSTLTQCQGGELVELEKLIKSIPVGKDHAIHLNKLAHEWGVSMTAAKMIIREARMQHGIMICSGSRRGYWIASNDDEAKEYVKKTNIQAFSRLKTTSTIKHSLNELKGQMSLMNEQMGASENGKVQS